MDEKNTPRWMPYLKHLFAVLVVGFLYLLLQPLFSPLLDKVYVYLLGLDLVGQIAFGGLVVLAVLYLLFWEVGHWRIFVPGRYYFWLILIGVLYASYCWGITSYPFCLITGKGCLAWLDLFILPWFVALLPGCVRRKVADKMEIKYLHLLVILARRPARRFLKWQKPLKKADRATTGEQETDEGSDSLLVLDNPLKDRDKDELGFAGLAKKLRNQLVELKLRELSTSLGIIAPWGYGKSSFLTFLEQELKRMGDGIIINFNPRGSRSVKHIQGDFFDTLTKELSKYYFGIGFLLSRYAKSLDLLDSYDLTRPIPKLWALLFPAEDKEAINDALKSIGKRLYIFIDDMDRLDAEEILETFKLIDRSASFSNTIFVTAYDKGYISHVLTAYLDKDSLGQCYADKYMTWEYSITEHIEEKLTGVMVGLLKDRITDGYFVTQESVLRGWYRVAPTIVPLLGSVRHLKRYFNTFIGDYVERLDEVDPGDFFLLSLLKYQDPVAYMAFSKDNLLEAGVLKEEKGELVIVPENASKIKEQGGNSQTIQILDQLLGRESSPEVWNAFNPGSPFRMKNTRNRAYYFSEGLEGLPRSEEYLPLIQELDEAKAMEVLDSLSRKEGYQQRTDNILRFLLRQKARTVEDFKRVVVLIAKQLQVVNQTELYPDLAVLFRNEARSFYEEQGVIFTEGEYRRILDDMCFRMTKYSPVAMRDVFLAIFEQRRPDYYWVYTEQELIDRYRVAQRVYFRIYGKGNGAMGQIHRFIQLYHLVQESVERPKVSGIRRDLMMFIRKYPAEVARWYVQVSQIATDGNPVFVLRNFREFLYLSKIEARFFSEWMECLVDRNLAFILEYITRVGNSDASRYGIKIPVVYGEEPCYESLEYIARMIRAYEKRPYQLD